MLLARLPDVVPGIELLARDLLAAEERIDFVGLEPTGRVTLVLVGEEDEDLELVGRALAHRAWVEERLPDWLQLAPRLGIRPEAGVRVLLLCHALRPETIAAARALGTAVLGLARYRCVSNGAGVEALVESMVALAEEPTPDPSPPPPTLPERERPPEAPSAPPPSAPEVLAFRTGLTDADLGLTDAERGEFE